MGRKIPNSINVTKAQYASIGMYFDANGGRLRKPRHLAGHQWPSHAIGSDSNSPPALLNWYRMEFTLPYVPTHIWVPWCLRLEATGNGFTYLNGKPMGRYWQYGGQREFYMPDNWLQAAGKKNVLALCLRPLDNPTAVSSAAVGPYRVYAEYRKV
ncbi:MAG: beta galactosidase jelly roll domain-containing protein [Phycisphaerae bacterium]